MNLPICSGCIYGLVQQRESERGSQTDKVAVWCEIIKGHVPSDLTFCSHKTAPGTQIHPLDTIPEPLKIQTPEATKKKVKEVLLALFRNVR